MNRRKFKENQKEPLGTWWCFNDQLQYIPSISYLSRKFYLGRLTYGVGSCYRCIFEWALELASWWIMIVAFGRILIVPFLFTIRTVLDVSIKNIYKRSHLFESGTTCFNWVFCSPTFRFQQDQSCFNPKELKPKVSKSKASKKWSNDRPNRLTKVHPKKRPTDHLKKCLIRLPRNSRNES